MQKLHIKLIQKYPFYHNWHQTKHHNKVHWGVLVGFVLVVFSLIFNSAYDAVGNESGQSSSVSAATPPAQQIFSLEPVADTYVNWWEKTSNYGTTNNLKIYADMRKVLLRFDTSAIPANATILSAELKVTINGSSFSFPLRFSVYDVDKDFVENQADYLEYEDGKAWSKEGLGVREDYYVFPFSGEILVKENKEYTLGVTDFINQLRAVGKNNVNLTLFSGAPDYGIANIYSREHADASKRPKLVVNYSLTAPQARAGDDLTITNHQFGNSITVDGSSSSLPDGTKTGLSYLWTMDKPAPGSTLTKGLVLGESSTVSFNPDKPGRYILRLKVTNLTTNEYSEDTVDVLAISLPSHFRLHMNQGLFDQILSLKSANDPLWTRFYNWVKDKPTYSGMEGGLVSSYLLAYQATGETQYFDWAWDLMKTTIYKNGVDNSGGLKTLFDLYPGGDHDIAFQGGPRIATVAILYDWGYDLLNAVQKQDLIDWLNAAVTYNHYNGYAGIYFQNDSPAVTYGLAASVYATLGENPQAITQLKWLHKRWDKHLETLDIMKGGALAEGNSYGSGFYYIKTADLVYYASGEDLFLSHSWFKDRLAYDAFATYPDTINGPGSPIPWSGPNSTTVTQVSIGGDGGHLAAWVQTTLIPKGLILARRFSGTEEANMWNYVFRQPSVENGAASMDSANAAYLNRLLYYSPLPSLVKPTRLSYYSSGLGYVFIRSDWDSSDATHLAFWASPHLSIHQHLDKGGFTVFKRRDLAPKTGNYDTGTVFAPHQLAYYYRTVSSNNILIGDPNEIFRGFIAGMGCDGNGSGGGKIPSPDNSGDVCIPNDGGQRTMNPLGLSLSNADEYNAFKDIYETAKVVSFDDQGSYVSIVADITNAYNNPRHTTTGNTAKVNKVYRRLVYVRDLDLLLIGDTVESTNANFEKKWLLHSLDQLNINGDVQTVKPGEEVHTNINEAKIIVDDTQPSDQDQLTFDLRKGYSSLLLKTLFPAQFQYRKIGGREPAETIHGDMYRPDPWNMNAYHYHNHINDFYVKDFNEGVIPNHKSFNWIPEAPIDAQESRLKPSFVGGYGRYRLELEPTVPAMTDYFLNVLKPSLDTDAVMPQSTRIETATTFGAEIVSNDKKYTITFSKETLDNSVIEITSLVPDTIAPSIPTNLTATPISPPAGGSQINLSWTASTDNTAVTGYKIYRCLGLACAPTTQIATSPTSSYSNTGLTASTVYTYAVSAYDAAGNESAQSAPLSVTTFAAFKQSDLNQDGKTDQLDFDILKQDYNRTDQPKSDLNQDGIVDSRDLGILMSSWNP